jgi:hypothetical protein
MKQTWFGSSFWRTFGAESWYSEDQGAGNTSAETRFELAIDQVQLKRLKFSIQLERRALNFT